MSCAGSLRGFIPYFSFEPLCPSFGWLVDWLVDRTFIIFQKKRKVYFFLFYYNFYASFLLGRVSRSRIVSQNRRRRRKLSPRSSRRSSSRRPRRRRSRPSPRRLRLSTSSLRIRHPSLLLILVSLSRVFLGAKRPLQLTSSVGSSSDMTISFLIAYKGGLFLTRFMLVSFRKYLYPVNYRLTLCIALFSLFSE